MGHPEIDKILDQQKRDRRAATQAQRLAAQPPITDEQFSEAKKAVDSAYEVNGCALLMVERLKEELNSRIKPYTLTPASFRLSFKQTQEYPLNQDMRQNIALTYPGFFNAVTRWSARRELRDHSLQFYCRDEEINTGKRNKMTKIVIVPDPFSETFTIHQSKYFQGDISYKGDGHSAGWYLSSTRAGLSQQQALDFLTVKLANHVHETNVMFARRGGVVAAVGLTGYLAFQFACGTNAAELPPPPHDDQEISAVIAAEEVRSINGPE